MDKMNDKFSEAEELINDLEKLIKGEKGTIIKQIQEKIDEYKYPPTKFS